MQALVFVLAAVVRGYARLPSLARALLNFAILLAVLTALKIQLDAAFPRHYAHDPHCTAAEPVYQYRPCKPYRP